LRIGAGAGDGGPPGSQIRGVRDFVSRRHAAPAITRFIRTAVVIDGRSLDEIEPPSRPVIPPLIAATCGWVAHLRRAGPRRRLRRG